MNANTHLPVWLTFIYVSRSHSLSYRLSPDSGQAGREVHLKDLADNARRSTCGSHHGTDRTF